MGVWTADKLDADIRLADSGQRDDLVEFFWSIDCSVSSLAVACNNESIDFDSDEMRSSD